MKIWLKVFIAGAASLLFLSAIGVILSGIRFLGAGESPAGAVFPLLLAFTACYGLAWANSRSFRYSFVGAFGGILIGVPMSLLLMVPFGYWLANLLFPSSNLILSGSLGGAWLLWGVVATVEVLTDRLHINYRWLMMLIGAVGVMILVYATELISSKFGLSSNQSVVKLAVYTPLIWGGIVGLTNIRSSGQGNLKQGEKGEQDR